MERPPQRRQVKREEKLIKLPRTRPTESYQLSIDPAGYQSLIPDGSQTRQQHIEQHTTWSQHSLVGDGPRDKSPTALAQQDPSFGALLRSAAIIAQSQNESNVAEYRGKNGYIIKVTLTSSASLEVTIINHVAGPAGHELITTYDSYSLSQVVGNIRSGKWV
jgi:hypothetical protein